MRGGYIGRVFRVVVNEQQEEKARIVAVEGDWEYEFYRKTIVGDAKKYEVEEVFRIFSLKWASPRECTEKLFRKEII